MLSVKNLDFSYKLKRKSHRVFDQLTVDFAKGFNVILGPNGAGKSTFLKAVFGLLDYEGEITYQGKCLTSMKLEDKTKFMAYLPQMDVDVSTLTVLEMVLLGRLPELGHKVSDEDLEVTMNTLRAFNIQELATRNFSELSGGQKKLVFIAQTLVRSPQLILLDEPVNSLDLQKQLELCHLLQNIVVEQAVDVVVVLHDINLAARYAQHVVVFDERGKCYDFGTPDFVICEKMLRDVYGVVADVTRGKNGIPVVSPLRSVRGKSMSV